METIYNDDGYMIIPSPITPAPSTIHAVNGTGEWVDCGRADCLDAWRVVDARPGTHHWPIGGPKGRR